MYLEFAETISDLHQNPNENIIDVQNSGGFKTQTLQKQQSASSSYQQLGYYSNQSTCRNSEPHWYPSNQNNFPYYSNESMVNQNQSQQQLPLFSSQQIEEDPFQQSPQTENNNIMTWQQQNSEQYYQYEKNNTTGIQSFLDGDQSNFHQPYQYFQNPDQNPAECDQFIGGFNDQVTPQLNNYQYDQGEDQYPQHKDPSGYERGYISEQPQQNVQNDNHNFSIPTITNELSESNYPTEHTNYPTELNDPSGSRHESEMNIEDEELAKGKNKRNACKECKIFYKSLSGLQNHVAQKHGVDKLVQDYAMEPALKRGRPQGSCKIKKSISKDENSQKKK